MTKALSSRRFTDWGAPLPPRTEEEEAARQQETEEIFSTDYLYGTGVAGKWATTRQIQESNMLFWKDAEKDGIVVAWKWDCGIDYRSTPWQLVAHGTTCTNEWELPKRPTDLAEDYPYLDRIVPVVDGAIEGEEPYPEHSVKLVAETKAELESFAPQSIRGVRHYSTKTRKKETGKCYFKACFDIRYPKGQWAGHYLKAVNHLTRTLILGEENATKFEAWKGNPHDWVIQTYGHLLEFGG